MTENLITTNYRKMYSLTLPIGLNFHSGMQVIPYHSTHVFQNGDNYKIYRSLHYSCLLFSLDSSRQHLVWYVFVHGARNKMSTGWHFCPHSERRVQEGWNEGSLDFGLQGVDHTKYQIRNEESPHDFSSRPESGCARNGFMSRWTGENVHGSGWLPVCIFYPVMLSFHSDFMWRIKLRLIYFNLRYFFFFFIFQY